MEGLEIAVFDWNDFVPCLDGDSFMGDAIVVVAGTDSGEAEEDPELVLIPKLDVRDCRLELCSLGI